MGLYRNTAGSEANCGKQLTEAGETIKQMATAIRERDARIGRLEEALGGLVDIINAAGLLPLSNGVELGQTVWYVKASDRLAQAEDALHPAVDPGGKHAK